DDLRLNNPEIRRFSTEEVYNANLGNVLTDLDSALDSFLQARTSVGARLRALDDQESQNDKFIIDTRSTLSATQDLDYAEAISRFNLQQMSLQAAQQAFSQVQRLSLFNYL
ncbi:MAG: flagellin, partial [Methylicorpusculum sp.]|nr:flagellin [Methylicorpusculum sp.]